MRNIFAILAILSMITAASFVAIAETPECPDCKSDGNQAYNLIPDQTDIGTQVFITGGGGSTGNEPPVIKCKWEYDLDVMLEGEDCPPCGEPCGEDGNYYHDACPCELGLQVKPIIGSSVTVGYFAVVTDPQGVNSVDHMYVDVWHPDGSFKYQIEILPIGFSSGGYDKNVALDAWAHVITNHADLITYNGYENDEIYDELWEELAYIYYGEAEISYCQPGGYYHVGVREHDTYDYWCDYLYNNFWYIPTSAIEIDFTTLNYGSIATSVNKWVGGDSDMATLEKPTVRNVGNTPVKLNVWQDDMDFGQTGTAWNVQFDARLGAPGVNGDVVYAPYEYISGWPGVWIPGVLPLCTEDKMDFSIHVFKGMPGYTYLGIMKLFAYIDCDSYPWVTPIDLQGNAPMGVPDPYVGP